MSLLGEMYYLLGECRGGFWCLFYVGTCANMWPLLLCRFQWCCVVYYWYIIEKRGGEDIKVHGHSVDLLQTLSLSSLIHMNL